MSRNSISNIRARSPVTVCVAAVIAVLGAVIALESNADTISMPNVFSDGTTASADEVNANYDVLVVESNGQDTRISDNEDDLSGLSSCTVANQRVYRDGTTLRCYTPSTRYLMLASSAFTPSTGSIAGNSSGTARDLTSLLPLLASVSLPHGATVIQLYCGGNDASSSTRLRFVLRRNQPQIANVDMATAETQNAESGFKFVFDSSIISPVINNFNYNYYVRVTIEGLYSSGFSVGFCRIAYTEPIP